MIREIRIENLLLIERAELVLEPGLTVLTGETGAGKTVLAHALDLLTGGKARKGIVRPGASEAWVEGVFEMPDFWDESEDLRAIRDRIPEDADQLVLGRKVSAAGRTTAFIGGRSASAADLRIVSGRLVAFFGQHEHRKLTIGSAQLGLVDAAGGDGLREVRDRYDACWAEYRNARTQLEQLGETGVARSLDILRFELEEIEAASIESGEKDSLEAERARLRGVEGIRSAAEGASDLLAGDGTGGGAAGAAARASESLAGESAVDPELDSLRERLSTVSVEMDDLAADLRAYLSRLEADPGRLAEVEARLDLINRLEMKHGGSEVSILEHAERCRTEISALEGGADRERELTERVAVLRTELSGLAESLTSLRAQAAGALAASVSGSLADLAMDGAEISIELVPEPAGPGPHGAEAAEFLFSPNRGIEARPLRETGSGGELSRVMLALAGDSGGGGFPTLVFDEIDAGIGGNTAKAVGDRLRSVASGRQVLAITHLPQVASRADSHFTITKDSGREVAVATVIQVDGEERVGEITRMMGAGSGDEAATRHARELVSQGR